MKKNDVFQNADNGSKCVSERFKGNFLSSFLNRLKLLKSLLTVFSILFNILICLKDE